MPAKNNGLFYSWQLRKRHNFCRAFLFIFCHSYFVTALGHSINYLPKYIRFPLLLSTNYSVLTYIFLALLFRTFVITYKPLFLFQNRLMHECKISRVILILFNHYLILKKYFLVFSNVSKYVLNGLCSVINYKEYIYTTCIVASRSTSRLVVPPCY